MSLFAVADWSSAITSRTTPTPRYVEASEPQLATVVPFLSSPWLPALLRELRTLETTGQNIPGVGDLRIAHSTADHVRRLMTSVVRAELPKPTLAPFSGGGIALTWNIGRRELSFSAYPGHDDFVYMRTDDNEEVAADGLLTLEQGRELGEQITAFLTNPPR